MKITYKKSFSPRAQREIALMHYMNKDSTILLHTGQRMPIIALGTWQLTDDTPGTIERALSLGYRMIDTSGDYGTQPGIAEGLKNAAVNREDFFLVTKVEEDEDAYESTKKQLGELELEYADLMLIHRPPSDGAGEELWRGLQRARDEGFTKAIGVSNYSESQINALIADRGEVPVVNQIEWSPFGYSDEMFEYAQENKICIQAYSPLTRASRLDNTALDEIAAASGKTPAQILIRWNLQRGTVPIVKANRPEHLEADIDVFDFELSNEQMERLNGLNERYSSLGSLPYV